jgi:ferredoxin
MGAAAGMPAGKMIVAPVCPECFRVEEDDTLTVLIENPPADLQPKVEEAVRLCPRQAISLTAD